MPSTKRKAQEKQTGGPATIWSRDKKTTQAVDYVLRARASMKNVNTIVRSLLDQGYSLEEANILVQSCIETFELLSGPEAQSIHGQLRLAFSQLLEQVDALDDDSPFAVLDLKNKVLANIVKLAPSKIEHSISDKTNEDIAAALFKAYKKVEDGEDE